MMMMMIMMTAHCPVQASKPFLPNRRARQHIIIMIIIQIVENNPLEC